METGNIKSLSIGDIVEVPFGNKTEIGVVWNKQQTTSKKFKIKLVKKDSKIYQLMKTWFILSTGFRVIILFQKALF